MAVRQTGAWACAIAAGKVALPLGYAGPWGIAAVIVISASAGIVGYYTGDELAQSLGIDPDGHRTRKGYDDIVSPY